MLDEILQNIPFPLYIYDADNLKFLEVNQSSVRLYGYSREDFLQMDITDLYSPEDIQTLLVLPDEQLNKGFFTGPWRQVKKDGEEILIELNRTPIEFRGQKAILNIVKEVTEDYETHQQFQRYKSTWEYSNDIIIFTDREGFIRNANDLFNKTLGYSASEKNLSILNFVSEEDIEILSEEIFKLGTARTDPFRVTLKTASGENIPANLVVVPVNKYNGEIDGFNLIFHTIPEVKKEEFIIEKPKSKEETVEFGTAFLSSLFHEILTPLNVIIGFNQELIESIEKPSADQNEAIDIIKQNQNSLLEVMNTSAEYVALLQDKIEINPTNIAFVDLLGEIERNTQPTSELNNVELTYGKISSSLIIEIDPQKLVTLISIFLRFALKIARDKSTIYLSSFLWDENNFVVGIKDNRQQITQQFLNDIKGIFTTEESLLRQKFGLSKFSIKVFKELIKVLNADFQDIVREGMTTEYGFTMPLKFSFPPVEEKDERTEEKIKDESVSPEVETKIKPESIDSSEVEPPPTDQLMPEKTISEKNDSSQSIRKDVIKSNGDFNFKKFSCLYVEDQTDSQILFSVQMKDLKSIDYADSLENALPLLKHQKFDFVIMDINLKGEYNGLDALRVIQQMPAYRNVPVIAATAYALPGDKDKFIKAGFSGFIAKPVMRDKLSENLKDYLN